MSAGSMYRLVGILAILLVISISHLYSQPGKDEQYDRFIVKTFQKSDLSYLTAREIDVIKVEPIFPDLNLWAITLAKPGTKEVWRRKLNQLKEIADVYPDFGASWRRMPNDPDYQAQWSLQTIEIEQVWDLTTGGKAPKNTDIVVAVFDDGYQVDHTDLENNIWVNEQEIPDNGVDDDGNGFVDDYLGWNATEDNDEHRLKSHGTSVAGILGARTDNGNQIAGINWDIKIMLTSAGRSENISLVDIVKAYNYIYVQRKIYNETRGEKGAYVVVSNYSGGAPFLFPVDFPEWCEIYDMLGQEGVLNVSSAPNTNTDVDVEGDLPSTCPSEYLIVATNTNILDRKVENAGFGSRHVDIGAPGDGILTLAINDETDNNFTGASASAPHIAGVIGLLYSVICDDAYDLSIVNPSAVAQTMRDAILNGAEPNTTLANITTTGGRLNAPNSLELVLNTLGDCCKLFIDDVVLTPETCQGSDDGVIDALASGELLRGDIQYSIDGIDGSSSDTSGIFERLLPGDYLLTIYDDGNRDCYIDTTVQVFEAFDICALGAFDIVNLSPNPASQILTVDYQIDELKVITLQIHNGLGQLVYELTFLPELSGSRSVDIDIRGFAAGIYHASIQATGLQKAKTFLVAR